MKYLLLLLPLSFVGFTVAQPEPDVKRTYDVYCSPRADRCQLGPIALDRVELPEFIPLSTDVSNCIDELCYNDQQEVIGLNPDYHLF